MTRINTVALVNRHPVAVSCKRADPRPGTIVADVLRRLVACAGRPVALGKCDGQIRQLQDFYGCDISRRKDGRYVLRGRWIGTSYFRYSSGAIIRQRDL